MSEAGIQHFIKQFKGNLVIQPGSNHSGILRNDGARVPHPQTNFTGQPDKIITDKKNHFISITPSPYSDPIFRLLTWAMENYPSENTNGKEKEA